MRAPVPKVLTPSGCSFARGYLHHAVPVDASRQSTNVCVAGPMGPIRSKSARDQIPTQIGGSAQAAKAAPAKLTPDTL
eukprot:3651963-Lingulodinium_polyedra.AAC.1